VSSLQQIAPTVQWSSLDVFQRQLCQSFSQNIRLLAPAGSGKTQSLLWRCSEIYRRQDEKARFLVVTFTRAARDELRGRLSGTEFRGVADAIEVATLNAWAYRRIRAHHHSPRLLITERDKNYCAQNALQPVWRAHPRIERAMKAQPYVVGPVLMPDASRASLEGFLAAHLARPAAVTTDGWAGYGGLASQGWHHEAINLSATWGDAALRLPAIHLVPRARPTAVPQGGERVAWFHHLCATMRLAQPIVPQGGTKP
jgi:hypothetical protein